MKLIACPVALHPDGVTRRIAVCQHPTTGLQLVKAEAASTPEATQTAARTLYAMSMLETRAALPIGTSRDIDAASLWHFALCRIVPPVREQWKHLHGDHLLHFTWMPLDASLHGFTTLDLRALEWIRATL